MSDFPRGWTLSSDTNGVTCSVTVPAIAGVVHVLDAIAAKFINVSAGSTPVSVTLSSSDGVFSAMVLAHLVVDATAGTADEASLSGLDLAAGPGASLTITFSAGAAGYIETLVVQGHDI